MEAKYNQKWLLVIVVMELSLIVGTSSCKNKILLRLGPVSESDKWIILNAHNLFRQLLALGKLPGQPQAANLQEIKWDNNLAMQAATWSGSCRSEQHDKNRNHYEPVGQNIATYWTSQSPKSIADVAANFRQPIKDWFLEHDNYTFGKILETDITTGHYTQLIWHRTNRIGCGYSFYYDHSKGFTKNYVCNYAPSGNIIDKEPYTIGPPACSRFGLLPSVRYRGLCGSFPYMNLHQVLHNTLEPIKQLYNALGK